MNFVSALFAAMDADSVVSHGFGLFVHAFSFWNYLWSLDGDCFRC